MATIEVEFERRTTTNGFTSGYEFEYEYNKIATDCTTNQLTITILQQYKDLTHIYKYLYI